jgi:hypothetical protein
MVHDASAESLARANEANMAEGLVALARAYGGEVRDEPDLLWGATGIPLAGWNRVPRAQLAPETLDARIEWVIERARALRVPFLWLIGPSTRSEGLGDHLVRHGFTDVGEETAMGVALAHLPSALLVSEGVTVERVRDRASLEQWVRTLRTGFGGPASADGALLAALSRDDLGDAAAAHCPPARRASGDGRPDAGRRRGRHHCGHHHRSGAPARHRGGRHDGSAAGRAGSRLCCRRLAGH